MAERRGRLSASQHDQAKESLAWLWTEIDRRVELDAQLMTAAREMSYQHALGGYAAET
ncbi:MAG TPA: hypothetical protein VFJ14_07940 [Nocardioidaceae bacterium]|nr:hypothetical protein [Nocardioidaceae bacterium]